MELVWPCLIGFSVALAATLACERVAGRLGMVSRPREDRWGRRAIPLLGGVAIMAGVVTALVVVGPEWTRVAPFLSLALAIGAVGLFDDARPLRPQTKLVAQIVLAGAMIRAGALLGLTGNPVVDVLLTLLWIVGITNAFNLLDNMDGLAASMGALAAAFRLVFFVMDGDLAGARLSAGFLGATLGFLVRNIPPARIFMGDSGSLFIGFYLSSLCLLGEYAYSRGVAAVLVFPLLLMVIPIFDTVFVTVTRLARGRPISAGGADHTSHRLVSLGIGERGALAGLLGVSVLAGLVAVLSYRYGFTYTVVALALLLVGLFLLAVHLSRVHVERGGEGAETRLVRLVGSLPLKRQVASVAIDLVLIVVAYYAAYLLRFEDAFAEQRGVFLASVGPVITVQLSSLAAFGSYRGLWRYTGLSDLLRIVRAASVGVGLTAVYFLLTQRFEGLSRAVFVLDWVLLVGLLAASRVSLRLLREGLRPAPGVCRRVLIYGAGDGGELTLRELRKNPRLGRVAVGFLDDDPDKIGTRIHEVPVLGSLEAFEQIVASHAAAEVVVSSERISEERVRKLEVLCAERGIPVLRASLRLE